MQTNKEIKIAIIVGVIMITACILAFIYFKSGDNNINQIDIKVYKVNEEEKVYEQCQISTDTLIQINNEYKRISRLTDSSRVKGQSITGTYKVVSGDNFIAFDLNEDKNYIYRGDTQYLYEFDSDLYNIVASACR